MNEPHLIDQYMDALRQNPKATPPPGLDAETAAFVRNLVLSQQTKKPSESVRDRVWHKALNLAEQPDSATTNNPFNPTQNGLVEQQIRLVKSGQPSEACDADVYPIQVFNRQGAPHTRPPTLRYFWQYTLTIAAALVIIALLGGILIQMVYDPSEGYPGAESLQTEEPTVPACDPTLNYLAQGSVHVAAGDYEAAATAYQCAIEINPSDYAAYVWRGGLAAAKGDYDQVGYDLYAVMRQRVGTNDPLRISVVHEIPNLNEALRLRPDDVTAHFLRGLAYLVGGLSAELDFTQVTQLAPDNGAGYLLKWVATTETHLPDFNDTYFTQGEALAGDSMLMAWAASLSLSQPRAAVWKPKFDALLAENPNHPFAYEARGLAQVMMGDSANAANDFYRHIQNNRTDAAEEYTAALGETLTIEGTAGTVYRLLISAEAGQTITITETRSYRLFTLVYPATQVVLAPNGDLLPAPYQIVTDKSTSALAIQGLVIPDSGVYTLLVMPNSNGALTIRVEGGW